MRTGSIPFGALGFTLVTLGVNAEPDPLRTQARLFDLHYAVNEAAQPLDRVELYVTLDQGETWRFFGQDDDRQPPIVFHAKEEGLHGFFIVLANAAGTSSPPPTRSTQPVTWVFVDATPPIVQFHELRQAVSLGLPTLQIRWTAIDTYLLPRPIEISFQQLPDPTWHPITIEPLANTGRYDWRIPTELSGTLGIRLAVTDEGGHRVESSVQNVELKSTAIVDPPAPARGSDFPRDPAPAATIPEKARIRADVLVKEGIALRDGGFHREAIARFREALKHDPRQVEALTEIGGLLYRLGDMDRSLGAYDTALKIQPNLRSALRGSALVFEHQKDYKSASERLRAILRTEPNDAETWLKLGDLAVFQGDELQARECYARAVQADPRAAQVVAEARKRLVLMGDRSVVNAKSGRMGN